MAAAPLSASEGKKQTVFHKVCTVCLCVRQLRFSSVSDPCHIQEEAAWVQESLGSATLREARAELAEARKQWQSLQVEIETLRALVKKCSRHHRHLQNITLIVVLHGKWQCQVSDRGLQVTIQRL